MLVLSRKPGEKVVFTRGDQVIELCIVDIRGDRVRVGINAPEDVRVIREELLPVTEVIGVPFEM